MGDLGQFQPALGSSRPEVLGWTTSLLAVALILFAARMYSRTQGPGNVSLDDYAMCVAVVSLLPRVIPCI
jgi:hypothetical protein